MTPDTFFSIDPYVPIMPSAKTNRTASPPLTRSLARWWYVLRYYRKSQLARRACRRLGASLKRLERSGSPYRSGEALRVRDGRGLQSLVHAAFAARDREKATEVAEQILGGRLRLLNEERQTSASIDWTLDGQAAVPRLWRFHLHYHEFLLDLALAAETTGDARYGDAAWAIVQSWIENHPLANRNTAADAWHPYCISRRVPVWISLWHRAPPPAASQSLVLGSLAVQAAYLSRNLEWDLRGNHLLENVRGLTLAAAFFTGRPAERWLDTAGRTLRKELPDQVLPDGQHFERSPMYHARMLQAVLDVRDASGDLRPDLADLCQRYATPMAEWLASVLHPDGRIPLLADSAFDETPPAALLVRRAAEDHPQEPTGSRTVAAALHGAVARGDAWVWRDGGDFLVFDAGPVGADHLPAHAHSDLLTIEASLDGRRLFVDSGTFDYEDGPMRSYCRSTAAHNVLQVDGAEQCDMWSRFRMGYRGWPQGLATGQSAGFSWARAGHNAYRRIGVPDVGRWIACRPGGPWLCVDWARGRGRHRLTGRLHFHPDVSVELVGDDQARLSRGEAVATLHYLTPGRLTVEDGWYCPEFGVRQKCSVLTRRKSQLLPAAIGWCLSWDGAELQASLVTDESHALWVTWHGYDGIVKIAVAAPRLRGV